MPRSNQELTTNSSQTMSNKTKVISWSSSMVAVHEIEPYQNANQIWYQQDELKVIRKEIRKICSCFCIDNDYRGLETYMDPSTHRSQTLRRRELMQTVLEEQQDQQEQGVHAPDFIADLCEEISIISVNQALSRGFDDANVAADIRQEEETDEKEEEEEEEKPTTRATTRSRFSKTCTQLFHNVIRPKRVLAQSA